jgi:hypothetical protein
MFGSLAVAAIVLRSGGTREALVGVAVVGPEFRRCDAPTVGRTPALLVS